MDGMFFVMDGKNGVLFIDKNKKRKTYKMLIYIVLVESRGFLIKKQAQNIF